MAPKKLLLIDDDKEILSINKKYLTGEGFQVYATTSPSTGIHCAKTTKPDCILLDVMMPEMDGFQLCAQIRKYSSAPVIFLTGRVSEDDSFIDSWMKKGRPASDEEKEQDSTLLIGLLQCFMAQNAVEKARAVKPSESGTAVP